MYIILAVIKNIGGTKTNEEICRDIYIYIYTL